MALSHTPGIPLAQSLGHLPYTHTHPAPHSLHRGLQFSKLLHTLKSVKVQTTHSPHSHAGCTLSAHVEHVSLMKASRQFNSQQWFTSLLLTPHFPGREGVPKSEAAENQGEEWVEEGHISSFAAVPSIIASQSSWGSLVHSTTRSLRDNGIIGGWGGGRPRQGLRRRCLLPSIHPSAPNERLRHLGTGGRGDTGGVRVAGPGQPNSISWAASISAQLWARRG